MNTENQKKIEEWKEEIKKMKEFELFLSIESFGGIIWSEAHAYSHGRLEISLADFAENQEYYRTLQKECLLSLKNFGIDPDSAKDKTNGDYWKWYNFWKEWMDAFSNDGWVEFNSKIKRKESIEDLLPSKHWNEN